MKLSPQKNNGAPNYPSAGSFFSHNREFLQILASLGIAAGAAVSGPVANTTPPKSEKSVTVKIPLGKLGATVDALCAKLGNKDFKVRRAAMLKLIQVGKGQYSTEKERGSAKEVVLTAVGKLAKHRDPEVRTRAAKVNDALTAKTVPPPSTPLKGVIRVRGKR